MNRARCKQFAGDYICDCLPGYTGIFCEQTLPTANTEPSEVTSMSLPERTITSSQDFSVGGVAGGVIGGVAVAAMIVCIVTVVLVWCVKKRGNKHLEQNLQELEPIY